MCRVSLQIGSTTMRVVIILLIGVLALMVALREARVNRTKIRDYNLKMAEYIAESQKNPVISMPQIKVLEPTCVAREFNLTITQKRCASKTIVNKFCYGQCSSFYVPGQGRPTEMFERCVPTVTVTEHVYLPCFKKKLLGIRLKEIKVTRVLGCGCKQESDRDLQQEKAVRII